MPTSASAGSVARDTASGRPSHVAPSPSAALHSLPVLGSATAPARVTPRRVAATDTAYQGSP